MAMVVKNNMAAVRTLNTLNSNSSALQKSLAKVSSGMKINSAQDDASGYAISERMRVQIRALDQANQNTQNGSSLMKTAEGAVASTIEILKTMKEKAINAATDTNTDDDRATIQKEINQFVDQIDDNALVTFNGKYLVEGSKVQSGEATYTALTNQSLAKGTTGDTALTALQNRKDEALGILATDRITASYVKDGRTYATTFTASGTTLKGIFQKLEDIDTTSQIFADSSNKSVLAADPSLAVAEADSTTGTSGGYDRATLAAAKADLEAQLAEAKAAQNVAVGELGSISQHSVEISNVTGAAYTPGTGAVASPTSATAVTYSFSTDASVTGAAGELAKVLVEIANQGAIQSGTNVAYGSIANGGNVGSALKGSSTNANNSAYVAVQLFDLNNLNIGNAQSDVIVGTTDFASGASAFSPIINLTGLVASDTNVITASSTSVHSWDGISGDSSTLKTAINNVISKLENENSYALDEDGNRTTDGAKALATKLREAYETYTEAVKAKEEADKAVSELEDKLALVDTAITAIDAKVAADEAKAGMADAIASQLTQLAHAAGNESTNTAGTAEDSVLGNNQYIGFRLLDGSKAYQQPPGDDTAQSTTVGWDQDGYGHVGTVANASFTSQYDTDDESTIQTIAQEMADKIAANIEYYVTGNTSTETSSYSSDATAASAMKAILNTVGVYSNNTTYSTNAFARAANLQGTGVLAAVNYQNAYGVDSAGVANLSTTDELNWAGAKADINGWAAKYDTYIQAAYSVTQNQKDLDKVMTGYTAPASDGPALLSGSAIGLNTSGEIVKTADETDGITITANGEGLAGQIAGVTISVADAVGNAKKSVNASLNAFKTTIFAANESKEDTSLKLHVGGAANQSLSVGMMDMRSQALGLKGSDGSVISVTTQDNANAAIAAFDNALAKALDQATTIGAIEARLEYTSSNLTTSSENVQAAESTIRDADMAKEMTTYTKNNVLLQAAQSMLAQANQNASAVLSLLQ